MVSTIIAERGEGVTEQLFGSGSGAGMDASDHDASADNLLSRGR
jgi:hypothetical protein